MMPAGLNMTAFKAWEIWLARVVFEEIPESKTRPVLIIPVEGSGLVQVKLTGTPPRDQFEHRIICWRKAGLSKETTIRTSKLSEIKDEDLIRKIGDLSAPDIMRFIEKFMGFQKAR
jgi:hypothetical protein